VSWARCFRELISSAPHGQSRRRRVAVLGILCHRLEADRGKTAVDIGLYFRWSLWLFVQNLREDFRDCPLKKVPASHSPSGCSALERRQPSSPIVHPKTDRSWPSKSTNFRKLFESNGSPAADEAAREDLGRWDRPIRQATIRDSEWSVAASITLNAAERYAVHFGLKRKRPRLCCQLPKVARHPCVTCARDVTLHRFQRRCSTASRNIAHTQKRATSCCASIVIERYCKPPLGDWKRRSRDKKVTRTKCIDNYGAILQTILRRAENLRRFVRLPWCNFARYCSAVLTACHEER
jgi:hypothetical protein